jgi:uncharacterized NAD(P)/FAD-binding protein YdhS
MTTRRVRRTIRRSGGGINVVADVNAVISTGGSASSSATTSTVTQRSARSTRRTDPAAGDPTRGDH